MSSTQVCMKAFLARTNTSWLNAETCMQDRAISCMCCMLLSRIGCTQQQCRACLLQILRQMCSVNHKHCTYFLLHSGHLMQAHASPILWSSPKKTKVPAGLMPLCRMRVACFHNAGSAEDMFTSEGTGVRKAASPLLVRHKLPCLALQS